jgi:SAM-dependent methyltransferase
MGWSVTGQDVDPAAVAQVAAKGLRALAGPLEGLRLPDESFDAIVMNHVIEHVHNPLELMAECRRLLKPKGPLVSITPNTRSWGAARFGRDWTGLDVPRHLHLYAPLSLGRLALESGFERYRIWTTPAKASSWALGSLSLAGLNRFDMLARAPLQIEVAAALLQYRALFAWWLDHACGDECVLFAQR